jgi:hypothetical protein
VPAGRGVALPFFLGKKSDTKTQHCAYIDSMRPGSIVGVIGLTIL